MKGLKKLSLVALSLVFVAGLAACTKSNNANNNNDDDSGQVTPVTPPDDPDTPVPYVPEVYNLPEGYIEYDQMVSELGDLSDIEQPSNYPGVYVNPDNKVENLLTGIEVYTISTDTTFYLGQEFSARGTYVMASFIKLDENGDPAKDESGKTISFIADVTKYSEFVGDDVNTNVLGAYQAQVNFRYGETVKSRTYTVRVRSSEFETTKGLKYIAGIKAGFKSEKESENFALKNNGRIAETYLRKNATNDFTFDVSDINLQLVRNTVNSVASAYKTEYVDFDLSTLTNDTTNKKLHNADNTMVIDYSAVDTGKVGSYLIPITYSAGTISVKGQDIENVVHAFMVVDVISPVYNVIINSNNITIEASMDLPDFSAYKAMVTRRVWDTAQNKLVNTVVQTPITNDLFRYEGIVSYNQGTQPTKFIFKEIGEDADGNPVEFSIDKTVTITESTQYNIKVVKDMTGGTATGQTTSNSKTYYATYDLGNGVKAYNIEVTNIGSKSRTCEEDGLQFVGFAGLDSMAKNSYFEFTFTKKTKVILYIGSNGDDERGYAIYGSDNKKIYEEIINPSDVGGKQMPKRIVYEFEAGTYKITALSTTMTFHGYVIGTSK